MLQTKFDLDKLFTEASSGNVEIVKEQQSEDSCEHTVLKVDGEPIMSTDPKILNRINEICDELTGDVLICGLGLGAAIFPLLHNRLVRSVVVLEYNEDIINIIKPIIQEHDTMNKVHIFHQDAYNYETTSKFNSIYLDIWSYFSEDVVNNVIPKTKEKYSNFLHEDGSIYTYI